MLIMHSKSIKNSNKNYEKFQAKHVRKKVPVGHSGDVQGDVVAAAGHVRPGKAPGGPPGHHPDRSASPFDRAADHSFRNREYIIPFLPQNRIKFPRQALNILNYVRRDKRMKSIRYPSVKLGISPFSPGSPPSRGSINDKSHQYTYISAPSTLFPIKA